MEDYFAYTGRLFNPTEIDKKPEILKGLRVLDFSHVIFGPTATRLLAQYGAEVIKFELPFHGDLWRSATYWGKYWKHSSPFWHFVTQNKYFLGVDLKKPEAKEAYKKAGFPGTFYWAAPMGLHVSELSGYGDEANRRRIAEELRKTWALSDRAMGRLVGADAAHVGPIRRRKNWVASDPPAVCHRRMF